MAIYYISNVGNDTTGDGSIGNPWATFKFAWTSSSGGDGIHLLTDIDLPSRVDFQYSDGLGNRTVTGESGVSLNVPASVSGAVFRWFTPVGVTFNGVDIKDPIGSISGVQHFRFNGSQASLLSLKNNRVDSDSLLCVYNDGSGSITTIDNAEINNAILWSGDAGSDYTFSADNSTFNNCAGAVFTSGGIDSSGTISITDSVFDTIPELSGYMGPIDASNMTGNADFTFNQNTVLYTNYADSPRAVNLPVEKILAGTSTADVKNNVFWISGSQPSYFLQIYLNDLLNSMVCDWRNYFIDPVSANGLAALSGGVPSWDLTDTVIGMGDSISNGQGASDDEHKWFNALSSAGFQCTVDNHTAIGGLTPSGLLLNIDRAFAEHAPKMCFVGIGVNGVYDVISGTYTPEQWANGIIASLEKIKAYGSIPLWLGCSHKYKSSVSISAVLSVNSIVKEWCDNNGLHCADIAAEMITRRPTDWYTYYYERDGVNDIDDNLHPNDLGHALLAELARSIWVITDPTINPRIPKQVKATFNPEMNVERLLPDHFIDEYPKFILFLEKFYEWMYRDSGLSSEEIKKLYSDTSWYETNIDKFLYSNGNEKYINLGSQEYLDKAVIRKTIENSPGCLSKNIQDFYTLERKYYKLASIDDEILQDSYGRNVEVILSPDNTIQEWFRTFGFKRSDLESTLLDDILLIKTLKHIYDIKGTEKSINLFFNLFFSESVEIELPKFKIAQLDNNFQLDNIESKLRDDYYYDEFAYVIKTNNVSTAYSEAFMNIFNQYFHPSGFKYFIEQK